jgi:hypothetical protein
MRRKGEGIEIFFYVQELLYYISSLLLRILFQLKKRKKKKRSEVLDIYITRQKKDKNLEQRFRTKRFQ